MECFVLRILGGPVVISYQHDLRQITLISLVFILMVCFMYFQSVTLDKEKLLGFSQHLHPLSQT